MLGCIYYYPYPSNSEEFRMVFGRIFPCLNIEIARAIVSRFVVAQASSLLWDK